MLKGTFEHISKEGTVVQYTKNMKDEVGVCVGRAWGTSEAVREWVWVRTPWYWQSWTSWACSWSLFRDTWDGKGACV